MGWKMEWKKCKQEAFEGTQGRDDGPRVLIGARSGHISWGSQHPSAKIGLAPSFGLGNAKRRMAVTGTYIVTIAAKQAN
jgi:hypothetical protein